MSFKSKVAIAFGSALLILVWIGLLSYRRSIQTDQDQKWVTHTHIVIERLDALRADLLDAETGERGYVVTGDDAFLQPYEAALRRVSEDQSQIHTLTSDNPRQQAALVSMGSLVADELNMLASGVEARRRDGMAAGAASIQDGSGKLLMDQLRVTFDAMKQEEWRLLRERSDAAATSSEYARDTIVFGYLSAAMFLIGAGCIIYEEMLRRKAAEDELRRSEEQLRLMVSSVTEYAIFMLDPKGYIVTWNAGAQRIKGYSAAEIIGQHFSRFYSSEDLGRRKPDHLLRTAVEEGHAEDEGWRVRKDGSRFWANVSITALHDNGGNLRGFAKVTRDMTDAKRIEAYELLHTTARKN
jgi:PAS domain S-box-containing protein